MRPAPAAAADGCGMMPAAVHSSLNWQVETHLYLHTITMPSECADAHWRRRARSQSYRSVRRPRGRNTPL